MPSDILPQNAHLYFMRGADGFGGRCGARAGGPDDDDEGAIEDCPLELQKVLWHLHLPNNPSLDAGGEDDVCKEKRQRGDNRFRHQGSVLDGSDHTCAHFGSPKDLGDGTLVNELVVELDDLYHITSVTLSQNRFLAQLPTQRRKLTQPFGFA
jgi:hypothetical protein